MRGEGEVRNIRGGNDGLIPEQKKQIAHTIIFVVSHIITAEITPKVRKTSKATRPLKS